MENTNKKQKIVYVVCGIPGSGKSTWINKNYIWDYDFLISRDAIRFNLLKDGEDYFSKENEVKKEFYKAIYEATHSNNGTGIVFIDATHLTPNTRKLTLNQVASDAKIIAVDFNINLLTAISRNAQRTGRALVPEHAIRRMYGQYVTPRIGEGFDEIWHINDEGIVTKEVRE